MILLLFGSFPSGPPSTYAASAPTIIGYNVGGTGADGALNVTSGTTYLNANQEYNFTSITIATGATLSVNSSTGAANLILRSQGSVRIHGTVNLANLSGTGAAYTTNLHSGVFTVVSGFNGRGGNGGPGASYGGPGGGNGGGGGAGANGYGVNPTTGGAGGAGTGNGDGGGGGSSFGNNGSVGAGYVAGYPGGAGAAGAAGPAPSAGGGGGEGESIWNCFAGAGGGGGGGGGRGGLGLIILSNANIIANGTINTSGSNGGNGANGGSNSYSNGCGYLSYGSSGGSGGQGGGAGDVKLYYSTSISNSTVFVGTPGAGGSAGGGGNCTGANCGGAGSAGSVGPNGRTGSLVTSQTPMGEQYLADGTTPIANGSSIDDGILTNIVLKQTIADADNPSSQTVFFNIATNTGTLSSNASPTVGNADGSANPACASGTSWGACVSKIWYSTLPSGNYTIGGTVSVNVTGLTPGMSYKWQSKAMDDTSLYSGWVSFNSSTPNFTVNQYTAVGQTTGNGAGTAFIRACSITNGTNPTAVNDNDDTTYCQEGSSQQSTYAGIIFSSGATYAVNRVRVLWYPSASYYGNDWTVQGSTNTTNGADGSWTTLSTVTNNAIQDVTTSFSNTTFYKAVKINVTKWGGGVNGASGLLWYNINPYWTQIQGNVSPTISSASTSASYLYSGNNTAFPIACNGVTDSDASQTITCQGSWDNANWYTIGSSASPLSSATINGTPNVSTWTGYPADGVNKTIYVRVTDGTTTSSNATFTVTKDVAAPTGAGVTYGTINPTDITVKEAAAADATSGLATSWAQFQRDGANASGFVNGSTGYQYVGLSANTQYAFQVQVKDTAGNTSSYATAVNKYTAANVPGIPATAPFSTRRATVIVNPNSNPAPTNFAIAISPDNWVNTYYLPNPSGGISTYTTGQTTAVWNTYVTWGSTSGITVNGLTPNTTYYVKVMAQNGDALNTAFGTQTTFSTSESMSVSIDSNSVALGTLAQGAGAGGSSTLTINTNDENGFTVSYARANAPATLVNGTHSIAEKADWSSGTPNSAIWSGSGFGGRVKQTGTAAACYNSTWWGADDTVPNAKYAGIPAAAQTIANQSSFVSGNQDVVVEYKLVVPLNQATGTYSGGVNFTVTGNP